VQPSFVLTHAQSIVGPAVMNLPDGVEHGFDVGGRFDGGIFVGGTAPKLVDCGKAPVPANTGVPATRRSEERARTDVIAFIVISFVVATQSRVAG
jgi:hypothetical protein